MYGELIACFAYFSLVSSEWQKVEPPNIIVPSKDDIIYVDANKNVTVPCEATGSPTPKFSWLRNNETIRPGGSFIKYSEKIGQLFIPNFTSRESGDYVCIAWNVINGRTVRTVSPTTKLIRMRLSGFANKSETSETGREGHPLSVTCDNPPKSQPPGQFQWYYTERSTEIQHHSRMFIDAEGTLHFAYLKKEDEAGSPYKCAVASGRQNLIVVSGDKTIKVESTDTPLVQFKPKVLYHTANATGILRGKIILECFFSGNPVPGDYKQNADISWSDPSGKIIKPSAGKYAWDDSHKRVLEISDLVEEDEGVYKCTGRNSLGSASADIFLNVTSPPIVVEGLHSQTVTQGKDAEFTCVTRAATGETEPPPPTWFKNARVWSNVDPDKYVFSDNKRRLTVKNVQILEDISCFQCRVQNNVGNISGDGCLNVVLPITITIRPPEIQEITKGDIVDLTVEATTEDGEEIKYSWFFNGTKVSDTKPKYVTFNAVTHTAYINTSELTDEEFKTIIGTYTTNLYHTYDSVNVTTTVLLKELQATVAVVGGQTDVWWIALIIPLILIIVVIIIIAVVYRSKQKEIFYPLDKKERAADLDPEKDLADGAFHDLSRSYAADDFPIKPTINLDDDLFSDNEVEAARLMEYGGDIDPEKFNEDGSFIGQYAPREPPPPVSYQTNEDGIRIVTN